MMLTIWSHFRIIFNSTRSPIVLLLISVACRIYGQQNVPENLIARPKFINKKWNFEAGTAFYLKSNSADGYIVTAHHLFGPMGGLENNIHPNKLKEVVTWIQMTGIKNHSIRKFQVKPLFVPDNPELTSQNPFYSKFVDLAIFKINNAKEISWGTLSRDTLKIGDVVWQAGEPLYGQKPGELLHGCRVTKIKNGLGFCLFDNQQLILNGTSGSPYVNSKGEVLGLHSGSLKEPGNLTGIILLATIIQQLLE